MRDRAAKTRDSMSKQFSYVNVWDAEKIKGCVCDPEYNFYDCTGRVCPNGDDPLTTGQVNEVQIFKCSAISGGFTLFYNGYPSRYIHYYATAADVQIALLGISEITGIKVTFSQPTGTVCQAFTNVISVEFTQQFGPQNPLVAQIDNTMKTQGGSITVAADGLSSSAIIDASGALYTSVKGTKEADACANRGACITTSGVCSCYNTNGNSYGSSNGYGKVGQRGECGFITSGLVVSTCPGALQCSGHGVCSKSTFRCDCDVGWTSGDCSQRTCLQGLSWFDYPQSNDAAHMTYATCSQMGTCDPTLGRCSCNSGFTGEACEYLGCPGLSTSPCSGNGRCMTMAELALWAEDNGDATEYTYGLDPNNPFTWDANRVLGCLCDPGFSGYDCSLRTCPTGDDPATYNDHDEVQFLRCTATEGTFVLSFRQARTRPIIWNATWDVVKYALQNLSTLTKLTVTFTEDQPPPLGTLNETETIPIKTVPEGMPGWARFNMLLDVPNSPLDKRGIGFVPPPIPLVFAPTAACNPLGTQIMIISFDTTHGDLPALIPDTTQLIDSINHNGQPGTGVINVFSDGMVVCTKGFVQKDWDVNSTTLCLKSVPGTTENAVCNNRGLCDTATGKCVCFPTWSSSDGEGNQGNFGDCGFRNDNLNGQ